MIITLCRRGLLKIYASFCELNISFCKTLTFRFADYSSVGKSILGFKSLGHLLITPVIIPV